LIIVLESLYTDRLSYAVLIVVQMYLLSRIKLQTPVWRCSGSPKGSSSFFDCSQKMPPAPAGGVSLGVIFTKLL